jgi:hypothetical protein
VRVDRKDLLAGDAGAEREPDGGSPLPRADLDDPAAAARGCRGLEQRATLFVAQPALDIRCGRAGAFALRGDVRRNVAPYALRSLLWRMPYPK